MLHSPYRNSRYKQHPIQHFPLYRHSRNAPTKGFEQKLFLQFQRYPSVKPTATTCHPPKYGTKIIHLSITIKFCRAPWHLFPPASQQLLKISAWKLQSLCTKNAAFPTNNPTQLRNYLQWVEREFESLLRVIGMNGEKPNPSSYRKCTCIWQESWFENGTLDRIRGINPRILAEEL